MAFTEHIDGRTALTTYREHNKHASEVCYGGEHADKPLLKTRVRTTPTHLEIWPPYKVFRNKAILNLLRKKH